MVGGELDRVEDRRRALAVEQADPNPARADVDPHQVRSLGHRRSLPPEGWAPHAARADDRHGRFGATPLFYADRACARHIDRTFGTLGTVNGERGTVTADPTGHELNIGERIEYTREQLPSEQRELYEHALRQATERALTSGDYGPLGDVVEQWYRAAFIEHHGGEDWQRTRSLIEEGHWDDLAPGPARDADEVIQELLH